MQGGFAGFSCPDTTPINPDKTLIGQALHYIKSILSPSIFIIDLTPKDTVEGRPFRHPDGTNMADTHYKPMLSKGNLKADFKVRLDHPPLCSGGPPKKPPLGYATWDAPGRRASREKALAEAKRMALFHGIGASFAAPILIFTGQSPTYCLMSRRKGRAWGTMERQDVERCIAAHEAESKTR